MKRPKKNNRRRNDRRYQNLGLEPLEDRCMLSAVSDAAYALLNQRVTANQQSFFVYQDANSGLNHGFPSNFFASPPSLIEQIGIDLSCIDDLNSESGCSTDPNMFDRARGTVWQLTFPPLAGSNEFEGVGFQEPEDPIAQPLSQGYDLSDATHVLLQARTPTVGGLDVQFGVEGSNTDNNNPYSLTADWAELSIDLSDLRNPDPNNNSLLPPDLTDTQQLFAVVLTTQHAPGGGTVLLNDIRFVNMSSGQEVAPANPTRQPNGEPAPTFPVGNETFGVVPAVIQVVDDGDAAFAVTGNWAHDDPVDLAYRDDQTIAFGIADGSDIAVWTFDNLEPRIYEVQTTWLADPINATNAPFSLFDDALLRSSMTVDQTVAPVGSTFDTTEAERLAGQLRNWQTLGLVQVESGTLRVELSNLNVNGIVVADGMRIVPTIPPDQAIRNLTTIYESALTVFALLDRGESADLANARLIADSIVYAMENDPTAKGGQLPTAPDGSRGLRDAYGSGDLAMFNDQGIGLEDGKQGQARLSGFSSDERLCGESGYCLVLDGAFGGNDAFGVMALMSAYFEFRESKYLDSAKEIGGWIYGNLVDPNGPSFNVAPADETFGGYFLGYPDQGVPKDRVANLIRGKSIENNADIFSAFTMIAAAAQTLGDTAAATMWTERANIAGDFVMALYDPGNPADPRDGRFYTGTLFDGPDGLPRGPGLEPDGPRNGMDVANIADVLDSNTFTTLALAQSPRYRAWIDGNGNPIDWREPVRHVLDTFRASVIATTNGEAITYHGFNIVPEPTGSQFRPGGPIGGLSAGIAWEFTAQVIVTAGFVERLYGVSEFAAERAFYLNQLQLAQSSAPFGDGMGIVAATIDGEDDNEALGYPPLDQCLGTPFQCIAERVGLAATTWAIYAERDVNFFAPQLSLPQQTGQNLVADDWDFDVTLNDLGFNYFGGNTGATETVEGTTTIGLSAVSNGSVGGSLDVSFDFTGQATEVFAGYFASLFGLTDTLVSLDGSGVQPANSTPFPDYFLDTQDIYRGFVPFANRSVEQLQFDVRLESASELTVKIEVQDENGFDAFTRRTFIDTGANWQTIALSLPNDFNDSVQGGGDPSAFNWREVSTFSLIVERNNLDEGIANPATGQFLIDNLQLVDSDGQYPNLDAIRDPVSGGLLHLYETGFLDHVRASSAQYFSDWASTDSRTGGIIQDRSSFADLMTVGGVGFQLTTFVIDAERGYMTRDDAAVRVRDILRVLHDQPQGPDALGTIGHEGFFYHFLGIDGLRKQNFDFTATAGVDESLNTVELSTIDTALAVAGAVTAGAYFSDDTPIETEIRQLSNDIYGRVNWPFMLNSDPGMNAPRDESDMFFLGWKPNENHDGAAFEIQDARGEGSYSGIVGDPGVVDFYTDEGLLIALLAMGSPNPDHRLPRDVWDALIRETDGDSFIKTFPGALFTYEFASVWLDTEALGVDNHQAINGRPALPINFFDNSRAAMLTTREHAIANPNDRVTWQNDGGQTRWGISAAEGPFDKYFAYGAPDAAQNENLGEFVSGPAMYMVEAEDGTGDGSNVARGNASGALTVQLDAGESRTMSIDLPFKTQYEVIVRYSNDNFGPFESLEVSVDGLVVGSFFAQDTGDFGLGWDVFVESNPLGPIVLGPGTHDVTITVNGGDGFGVEIDKVTLQHGEVRRPLEDGTTTVYGAGSAIRHIPEYTIPALWDSRELGLLHPRFGFADAFNLEIADAVMTEKLGGEILRTSGRWANLTGFSIDHGPMLAMIDNYLSDNFVPSVFMSNPSIAQALALLQDSDYGDAPDTYLTVLASNGPRHALDSGLFLGANVDPEGDAHVPLDASGDDVTDGNDDEDGVSFGTLRQGRQSGVIVVASTAGKLDAFVDFNADGDFADTGEKIFDNLSVAAGSNSLAFRVPSTASASKTFARFRISTTGGLTFEGLASDGEVEDYAVRIKQGTDLGDAPNTYATTLTSNGARHLLGSPLFLGAMVDGDSNGQPNPTATGDDNNFAPDDEDGVTFGRLRQGRQAGVTVVASAVGKLDAFVDFNADGDFDETGEKIFDNLAVVAGTNNLAFRVPSTAAASGTFARFRISTTGGLTFDGLAGDGEVEDYTVRIKQGTDLGDAPVSYATTLASNGARHLLGSPLFFGALVDGDRDGRPNTDATGDDIVLTPNDEDGVTFATIEVGQTATVTVIASAVGKLDAFADFDIDGNFADAGEKILDNVSVSAGINVLNFAVPIDATSGRTFFRFRVSTAGGLSFNGSATDGEVEDHTANIQAEELLQAAGGEASPESNVESQELDQKQLNSIVDAAIVRFAAQGLSPQQLSALSSVSFAVADLPGATLGLATPRVITLDVNAAGYGWFVDTTPLDDSEFLSGSRLSTLDSQLRMDLLTAVMHELGHALDWADEHGADSASDLMHDVLALGQRRASHDHATDAVFGGSGW